MMELIRKIILFIGFLIAGLLTVIVVMTPLELEAQIFLGVFGIIFALLLSRFQGNLITEILIAVSAIVSTRYIYWRTTSTLDLETTLDYILGYMLLGAEWYAYIVLLLGYFQALWPMTRKPEALPQDRDLWPTVDIFIPTYNEPLSVVSPTVMAAMAIDWPREKMNVYILDDGRRAEFRDFANKVKCNYIIRPDNKHAKAGNINHAMKQTKGELIAIFDCDHIATRSFLQMTVGWFLRDKKLAMLQTPHFFYNPDPIEKNTQKFRAMPNEGELFYGLVQKGNDLWNATFFCGSCAVIRREALEEVGGIAYGSVTEDALTALVIQRKGWNTAYIDVRQAAGLATDSLAVHIGQRIRWARGMVQIFRINNPLLGRGLSWQQRLCYLNAMFHFMYGIPRVVFLTAPLGYLIFGAHLFNASPVLLLSYAIPHLAHVVLCNSRIKGKYRYSFWDNVYEAILAVYIIMPTLVALINPKAGGFNVTAKGGLVGNEYFDRKIARPYVVMLVINMLGLTFGLVRLLLWDYYDADTVAVNFVWTLFNCVTIGMVLATAFEAKQVRNTHRVPMKVKVMITKPSGHTAVGETEDMSLGGCSLKMAAGVELREEDRIFCSYFVSGREFALPARVVRVDGQMLRLRFPDLTSRVVSNLVQIIFSRPDAWIDWGNDRTADRPFWSFRALWGMSLNALRRLVKEETGAALRVIAVLVVVGCVFLLMHTGWSFRPVVDRVANLVQGLGDRIGAESRADGNWDVEGNEKQP